MPPDQPPADGPLLAWLLAAYQPVSRTRVKEWLRAGRVRVNGEPVTRHDHPLASGDRVTLADGPASPISGLRPLPVVHEDEHFVVVDKPHGLLAVAAGARTHDTAYTRITDILRARRGGRAFVVHRLDRDTSGALLFARSEAARDTLQAGWEAVGKTYLAVVEGKPPESEGIVVDHLVEGSDLRVRSVPAGVEGARRAESRYRVVGRTAWRSLVEVELITGRKHQIRVHLAGLGCPVIGDRAYGARTDPARRLCLHAWRLAFAHPVTNQRIEAEAPPPEAITRFVPRFSG